MDEMSDVDQIRTSFLHQLVATAPGRQHLLSISVDAEEGDESGIFDQLAGLVDDPAVRRIVERHRDDEVRHAQLFRDCLTRLGLEKQPTPDAIRIIRQVGESTGRPEGVALTRDDIPATYALLLAIEERGVEQFPFIAAAFDTVDPETAEVYRRVARDERGHVKYCQSIGRRYAGDDDTWDALVDDARAIEADAFLHVGLANIAHCGEQGWVDADRVLSNG